MVLIGSRAPALVDDEICPDPVERLHRFRRYSALSTSPRPAHARLLTLTFAQRGAGDTSPGLTSRQLGHADGGALALRVYVHPLEENKWRAAAHLDRIIGSQG